MSQAFVAPLIAAGLIWTITGCVAPASRVPSRTEITSASHEPRNLYLLKQEIRSYVDSGRYDEDIAASAADATSWIKSRAVQRDEKPAVVFDLDETLLSNLSHMRSMDFGYLPKPWDDWVAEGRAPVIPPVRDAYLAARSRGIAVFFITGRRSRDQPGTEQNLRAAGLGGYNRIFYKPDSSTESTQAFKAGIRRALVESEGYTLIANIGDQQSDLDGGFAERCFKLPNPFYITK